MKNGLQRPSKTVDEYCVWREYYRQLNETLLQRRKGETQMSLAASASAQALRARIDEGGFAVALSGGGHRATLATLGALMAIVDRGLADKVIQIASVSGGTITNAFVAQRCHLETLAPGELDNVARQLATVIIRKGVLTKGWLVLLVLTAVILGIAVGSLLCMLLGSWQWFAGAIGSLVSLRLWLAVAIGSLVTLSVLLGVGLAVEWLLDRRYFRDASPAEAKKHVGRAMFKSLSGRPIDHVFCMTDLALGLPVYASSQQGGMIWRRLKPEFNRISGVQFQTFDASKLSIAELVRASAAFPGITPRRLSIPSDPRIDLVAELPRVAFLADGGLWNNLGTQVSREDGFIGSHAAWDDGVLRPYYARLAEEMPVLCFNGSAALNPTCTWAFSIPGIALLRSLLQATEILNANTVLPRVDAMRRKFHRRTTWRATRPDHNDPLDLVADLSPIRVTSAAYRSGALSPEVIRKSAPDVKAWESNTLMSVRLAREFAAKDPTIDWLARILDPSEPQGSHPACGFADINDWDALHRSDTWKQLVEKEGAGRVDAPTTLGRIESGLARRLIARGYLNTYLVSLFLAPLADGELDRLAGLSTRLDSIAGTDEMGDSQRTDSRSAA